MGLNICVYDKNGYELPNSEWDFIRQGHDVYFPDLINWYNVETGPKNGDWELEFCFRPTDILRIREDLKKNNWDDRARYEKLLDMVEKKGCWIEFC